MRQKQDAPVGYCSSFSRWNCLALSEGRITLIWPLMFVIGLVTGFQLGGGARPVVASSMKLSAEAGQETSPAAVVRTSVRRGGGVGQRSAGAHGTGKPEAEPLGTGVAVDAAPPVHCTLAGWSKRARLNSRVKLRCLGQVFMSHTLPSRRSKTLPSVRASPKSTTLFELLRCWPYQAVGSKAGKLVSAVNVISVPALVRCSPPRRMRSVLSCHP